MHVDSKMSARSHRQPSGDVQKKSMERSNTGSRASSYGSQQSERRRNQTKPAARSPASRGYPKECIGNKAI